MSPWYSINNTFFQISYSVLNKTMSLGYFWRGRVYYFNMRFSLNIADLTDDGNYPSEYERYRKVQLYGYTSKSKQLPHHTGIHYNKNDEQLSKLPKTERESELARRIAVQETDRTG